MTDAGKLGNGWYSDTFRNTVELMGRRQSPGNPFRTAGFERSGLGEACYRYVSRFPTQTGQAT